MYCHNYFVPKTPAPRLATYVQLCDLQLHLSEEEARLAARGSSRLGRETGLYGAACSS